MCIVAFNPHVTYRLLVSLYSKETKAQQSSLTCPRLHSKCGKAEILTQVYLAYSLCS